MFKSKSALCEKDAPSESSGYSQTTEQRLTTSQELTAFCAFRQCRPNRRPTRRGGTLTADDLNDQQTFSNTLKVLPSFLPTTRKG